VELDRLVNDVGGKLTTAAKQRVERVEQHQLHVVGGNAEEADAEMLLNAFLSIPKFLMMDLQRPANVVSAIDRAANHHFHFRNGHHTKIWMVLVINSLLPPGSSRVSERASAPLGVAGRSLAFHRLPLCGSPRFCCLLLLVSETTRQGVPVALGLKRNYVFM
jgi:hypothetical protein